MPVAAPTPQEIAALRAAAIPLSGAADSLDPLLARIGDARFVLLGEASHGTHEFYAERARITRRLIEEKGFTAVAVEADWPDALRVNRYVRGSGGDRSADEALGGFQRFPAWMWRNRVVEEFVGWLRGWNLAHPARAAGFYGLDLYSLHASIDAVLGYLETVDPEAARRARGRYGCFQHFGRDPQAYGYAATHGQSEGCEAGVVSQLLEMQRRAGELLAREGRGAGGEEFFHAEQNARLVRDAEAYYRAMFRGRNDSWNLRDRHMAETLEALAAHLGRDGGPPPRIVVWAHNSHLGDARATEMGAGGELNVGQLVRERWGAAAFLVGFSTYAGTVTAAEDWGEPAERKRVRPALAGSFEKLFHGLELPGFGLDLRAGGAAAEILRGERLERAIGVIYRPETERWSHYFHARLPEQFDAILHLDETRAVEPLERDSVPDKAELPETFPSNL